MAMIAMALTAILMSFSGIIIRNIEEATPWQINIYRNLAFILVISMIFLGKHRSGVLGQIREIKLPVIFASLGLSVTGITIVQALTYTTVANTMFVMSAVPFITMGLAYLFLGEVISRFTLISMIIASLGVILMVVEGIGSGSSYGNFMALVTALAFSSFAVMVRANKNLDMLPALILAGITIIFVSVLYSFDSLNISRHDLYLCILWGAGLSGVTHLVFILAARYIAAAELTLFGLFESALASFWVWIFISERPGFWALCGGTIVIISVAIRTLFEFEKD